MIDQFKSIADHTASIVELFGVAVVSILAAYALLYAVFQLLRREGGKQIFRETRTRLIRGILLGLEFLVAADIIHTAAVDLSYSTVGVLAILVAIRTFLSFTLEVELTGKWPWQSGGQSKDSNSSG